MTRKRKGVNPIYEPQWTNRYSPELSAEIANLEKESAKLKKPSRDLPKDEK